MPPKQLFMPELDIDQGGTSDHVSFMVLDDSAGHKDEMVKAKILPKKVVLKWRITAGAITLKANLLDVLMNKSGRDFLMTTLKCGHLLFFEIR